MRLSGGLAARARGASSTASRRRSCPLLVSRIQMKKRFDQPFVYDATLVVGRLRPAAASATP